MFSSLSHSSVVDQQLLARVLKSIFPHEENNINSRKKSSLTYPSGVYFELDIWIPKYNLCFEFQDTYHYVTAWYSNRTLSYVQHRDNYKRETAHKLGFSLIIIPCWWDGKADSLISTISFQRPDILPPSSTLPISKNPLHSYFSENEVRGVGELMLAAFPKDRQLFRGAENNWWMGEKYDGIRCCWNPVDQTLYTRAGFGIELSEKIKSNLPLVFLDSEAWFGRSGYSQSQTLLNGGNIYWHSLRIVAFDEPSIPFQSHPFEARYSRLLSLSFSPIVVTAPRLLVQRNEQADYLSQEIVENEGEGIILRKSFSIYEHGRSRFLVKLKGILEDKEAIVISREEDESLVLSLPNGTIFSVPSRNIVVSKNIFPGDIVSFSFLKGEELVNSTITKLRTDVSWDELVQREKEKEKEEQQKRNILDTEETNDIENEKDGKTNITRRHWTTQTMRLFLENVAKQLGLDPLLPETWYSITPSTIYQFKGGRSVIGNFSGGYINALAKLFPNIAFDLRDIKTHHGYLQLSRVVNRRQHFEWYAATMHFNANDPHAWYKQKKENILAFQGTKSMLTKYYRGNLPKALTDIFPDIGLDRKLLYALFDFVPKNFRALREYKNSIKS